MTIQTTLLNEQWEPCKGITIELRDADSRAIIERAVTDQAGIASFETPATTRYYFRPLITRHSKKDMAGGWLHLLVPLSGVFPIQLLTTGINAASAFVGFRTLTYNIDTDVWEETSPPDPATTQPAWFSRSPTGTRFLQDRNSTGALQRSLDGGTTWVALDPPAIGDFLSSLPVWDAGSRMWAVWNTFGLAYSDDDADTWTLSLAHPTGNGELEGYLFTHPTDANRIGLVAVSDPDNEAVLAYISINRGDSWASPVTVDSGALGYAAASDVYGAYFSDNTIGIGFTRADADEFRLFGSIDDGVSFALSDSIAGETVVIRDFAADATHAFFWITIPGAAQILRTLNAAAVARLDYPGVGGTFQNIALHGVDAYVFVGDNGGDGFADEFYRFDDVATVLPGSEVWTSLSVPSDTDDMLGSFQHTLIGGGQFDT